MRLSEFNRIRAFGMKMVEGDEKPRPAPTPKPAATAKPASPAPKPAAKPAPKEDAPAPAAPAAPSDAKLDAVKKLHKMAEKVFKGLDDMVLFANENGLKDVAAMIGTVEDAYWDMKRGLAKIRESRVIESSSLIESGAPRKGDIVIQMTGDYGVIEKIVKGYAYMSNGTSRFDMSKVDSLKEPRKMASHDLTAMQAQPHLVPVLQKLRVLGGNPTVWKEKN